MSPSDKIKGGSNSYSGKEQTQRSLDMDPTPEIRSTSSSDIGKPGTISSIPLITASLSTLKCSDNEQIKTFDPGEENGIDRLTCGSSSLSERSNYSGLIRNSSKNYKAGTKINKLADMLAKRSQNIVEVTENAKSNIADTLIKPKIESSVSLKQTDNVINFEKILNTSDVSCNRTVNSNELVMFRKNRRKSVPNHSCNLSKLQSQSTSKSCLDISRLFSMQEDCRPELNALGEPLNMLQTDESTKRKAIKKNFKNVELTLILPQKKKRFSSGFENISNKVNEKIVEVSTKAEVPIRENSENIPKSHQVLNSSVSQPDHVINSSILKKENKTKLRKSKRLVETSTQTTDVEFVTPIISSVESSVAAVEKNSKFKENTSCVCILESNTKNMMKEDSLKVSKDVSKCQYCLSILPVNDLKMHLMKNHSKPCNNFFSKCDPELIVKEEVQPRSEEVNKVPDVVNQGNIDTSQKDNRCHTVDEELSRKNRENIESKNELFIDLSCESAAKSSTPPKANQKVLPREMFSEEQLLEMEIKFYNQLSGNIQENLTHHLDGKVNKNNSLSSANSSANTASPTTINTSNFLSGITSNSGVVLNAESSRAPSPYKTRSKTPNPLPRTAKKFKKLPNWQQKFWEKYNFPSNHRYEHRFWDKNCLSSEKSAFYLKDLSCLDVKTQLIIRENIQKVDEISSFEKNKKSTDNLQFPEYLSLTPRSSDKNDQKIKCDAVEKKPFDCETKESEKSFKSPIAELPILKCRRKLSSDNFSLAKKSQMETINADKIKMMTRRQNSLDSVKDEIDESTKKRKGSLDLNTGQKMSLRRQTSLEIIQKANDVSLEKNQVLNKRVDLMNNCERSLSAAGEVFFFFFPFIFDFEF